MILAIDPGKMTGVVLLDPVKLKLRMQTAMRPVEFYEWLPTLLLKADSVVIEKFTISMRTVKGTRQHDALDIIGAVKYATWQHNLPLTIQTPADAKTAFSDATLRGLDLWDPSVHVRDATRHALLAARRSGHSVHVVV